jgi:transcriptional regulator with XRE-family HTH domain
VKNRLRMLRAERSWSQADLADRLGVSMLLRPAGLILASRLRSNWPNCFTFRSSPFFLTDRNMWEISKRRVGRAEGSEALLQTLLN